MGLLNSTPELTLGHTGHGPVSASAKPEPSKSRISGQRNTGRRGSGVVVALGLLVAGVLAVGPLGTSAARAADLDSSSDQSADTLVDLDVTNANLLAVVELLRKPGGTQFIISGDTKLFHPVTVHLTEKLSKMLEYVAASAGAKVTRDDYGVYTISPADAAAPESTARPKIRAEDDVAQPTATAIRRTQSEASVDRAPVDNAPRHWETISLIYVQPSFVLSLLNQPDRKIASPYRSTENTTIVQPYGNLAQPSVVTSTPDQTQNHAGTTSQGGGVVPVSGGGDAGLAPGRAATTVGDIAQQNAAPGAEPGAGGAGAAAAGLPPGITNMVGITEQNALLVRGSSTAIEDLRDFISKIDVPARQVQIKVEFVTASVDDVDSLGMTYDLIPYPNLAVGWSAPGSAGTGATLMSYSYGNVAASLQALLQTSRGKVITAPMITLTNNIPGSVMVTETIPYTTSSTSSNSSTTTSSTTVNTVSVPTGLTATARINGDDTVQLQLTPQVSTISATDANGAPTVTSQTVQTLRTVGNGETIVLGGLVQKTDTNARYMIPILSDLPLIGSLFRNRDNSKSDSELLLFVTPTILPVPGSTTTGEKPAPTDLGAAAQIGVKP